MRRPGLPCLLLVAGLLLRIIAQPLVSVSLGATWRAALVLSGGLQLIGLTTAIVILAQTVRGASATRGGFRQVLPFVACAFGAPAGWPSSCSLAACTGLRPDA